MRLPDYYRFTPRGMLALLITYIGLGIVIGWIAL